MITVTVVVYDDDSGKQFKTETRGYSMPGAFMSAMQGTAAQVLFECKTNGTMDNIYRVLQALKDAGVVK